MTLENAGAQDTDAGRGAAPVVMLHGFGQTGRCLGPLADLLAGEHRVVAPDLPGHGTRSRLGALDCRGAAEELARSAGPGIWFGYSMGGRLALHVALGRPGSVSALVVLGATAGIEDPTARAARRATDEDRARRLEAEGVEAFMVEWLAMDLFAGLPPEARFLEERGRNDAAGLAASLRNAGTGSMDPLWHRLGELEMPVLLLSGARDVAFGTVAERMAQRIGANATARSVPGAGHAAHLEAPEAVHELMRSFLGG